MKKGNLIFRALAISAMLASTLFYAVPAALAAASTFTAGATLNGQGGWDGGTIGFTEAGGVTNADANIGVQSWHLLRAGTSPGAGTPFSPQLPLTVGSPGCADVDPTACGIAGPDFGADGDRVIINLSIKAVAPADGSQVSLHEGADDRDDRTGSNIYFRADPTGVRLYTYCATAASPFFAETEIGIFPDGDWIHIEMDTVYPLTDPTDYTTWGTTTFKVNGNVEFSCTPWSHWWRFQSSWHNHYATGSSLKFTHSASLSHAGFYVDDVSIRILDTGTNASLASYNTSFEADTSSPGSSASNYYPQTTDISVSGVQYDPVTEITVSFDEDMFDPAGDSHPEDVTNPANWLLFEDGSNGTFETQECSTGVLPDDQQISVDAVSYTGGSAPFEATLSINGGTALPTGNYRLLACGTSSLVNLAGTPLNDGLSDSAFGFLVSPAATTGTTTATTAQVSALALPSTGFAPGVAAQLPLQPAKQAYSATGLALNIPSLALSAPIVGVPQNDGLWDVAWLGDSVGYLNGTAFPTYLGNTVLTAHVWGADNKPGPFYGLEGLTYGQQFTISAWGNTYTYEVRSNELFSPGNVRPLANISGHDWVTLITCHGYDESTDSYQFRRVVRAVLVSVD